MSGVVRSTIVRLRAEMGQFKKEWADAGKAVQQSSQTMEKAAQASKRSSDQINQHTTSVGRLSESLRKNRADWDTVGKSLLRTGAALTTITGLTVKAAMSWESSWAGVTKTVDGTPAQLAKVEKGLRGLAKSMPESHQEIAAVAEAAGQLGVKTKDIVAFTRTMVMLGDTTNLTADEAATSLAQLMNVMQTAPGDVDNLGAALVALGNDGASTEAQIVDMAQRIASSGRIIGLTEAQVLGLANALASSGINAEAGGTAISKVMIDISKTVATKGADLVTWAKVAGMSADEFSEKWKTAPAEALVAFTEGLGGVAASGGDVFTILEELGQSDTRVTTALLNMANSGDLLRKSFDLGTRSFEKNQALVDEAAKRYDTTAAKAEIAWNNIKDNAIDAGQALLPVVGQIAESVSSLGQAFGSLPGPVKGSLGALAGVTGVSLLAAGALIKVVTTVGDARAAFNRLALSSSAGARGVAAIGKGAGIAAAAIAALAVAANIDDSNVQSASRYTKAILALGDGGKQASAGLQDLISVRWGKDTMDNLIADLDPSIFRKSVDSIFGMFGLSSLKWSRESAANWDAALTSLVSSGSLDEAKRGFDEFAKAAEKQGHDLEWSKKQFPGYQDALTDLANETKAAAKEHDKFVESNKGLSMVLNDLSTDGDEAAKMLDAQQKAIHDAAMGFADFSGGVDLAKASLKQWQAELQKSATAQANWADNIVVAMARGVDEGVIEKFRELGPEGARMLEELVNGNQAGITKMNKIWGSFTGTADFLADLAEVPPEVITQLQVDGENVSAEKVAELADEYDLLPSTVVSIMEALDYSSKDIKKVKTLLAEYDKMKVAAEVGVDGIGAASEQVSGLQSQLNALAGNYLARTTVGVVNPKVVQPENGFILHQYAAGGVRKPGPESHIAQIAPAGAMRLWAEPETGGEAYIPLAPQKRKRSLDIWAETGSLLGVEGFASGGITKKQRARQAKENAAERRELRSEYKTDIRRGYADDAAGDLSSMYAAIDDLLELSKNKALSKKNRATLAKTAKDAEKGLAALYKRADAVAERLDDARSIQESMATALQGGFTLDDFTGKDQYGFTKRPTGAAIAAGASGYAARVKEFAGKLEKARKRGIPPAMLEEIVGKGLVEGGQILDALLSATNADITSIQSSYATIEQYSKAAGDVVAKAFDLKAAGKNTAQGLAEGFITGLEAEQKRLDAAMTKTAKGMEKALKKALGINSPSRKARGWMHDVGDGAILGLDDKQTAVNDAMIRMAALPNVYTAQRPATVAVAPPIDYDQLAAAMANVSVEANVTATVEYNKRGIATMYAEGRIAAEDLG